MVLDMSLHYGVPQKVDTRLFKITLNYCQLRVLIATVVSSVLLSQFMLYSVFIPYLYRKPV